MGSVSPSLGSNMNVQAVLTIIALGCIPIAVLLAVIDANRNPT